MMRVQRRGSIYVYLLITSSLVGVIGLSALYGARVEWRSSQLRTDSISARLGAESGVQLGLHAMRSDPNWRRRLSLAEWGVDLPFSRGTMRFEAIDPVDGDIADDDADPVLLIGVGEVGRARHESHVLVTTTSGLGSLEVAACSDGDITLTDSQLTSDQVIFANGDVVASGSDVYADVEASGSVMGGSYHERAAGDLRRRALPDLADAIDLYSAMAVPIDASLLTALSPNSIANSGFESEAIGPWFGTRLDIVETVDAPKGVAVGGCTGRADSAQAASQVVNIDFHAGSPVVLSMWVRLGSSTEMVSLSFLSGDDVTTTEVEGSTEWRLVQGVTYPDWPTGPTTVLLEIRPTTSTQDFFLDEVTITSPVQGILTMEGEVLSPSINPYIPAVSPTGVYEVDCNGADLLIESSRIVGTLVVRNPGPGSRIGGNVTWEPAVANYPALLVTGGPMRIELDRTGLAEAVLGFTLNPPGSAYPYPAGVSDADESDVYPSVIRGLIATDGPLVLSGETQIHGVVIGGAGIEFAGEDVELRFDPTYVNDPPIGFDMRSLDVSIVEGSWSRGVQP